jgi:hypothetical protein
MQIRIPNRAHNLQLRITVNYTGILKTLSVLKCHGSGTLTVTNTAVYLEREYTSSFTVPDLSFRASEIRIRNYL